MKIEKYLYFVVELILSQFSRYVCKSSLACFARTRASSYQSDRVSGEKL